MGDPARVGLCVSGVERGSIVEEELHRQLVKQRLEQNIPGLPPLEVLNLRTNKGNPIPIETMDESHPADQLVRWRGGDGPGYMLQLKSSLETSPGMGRHLEVVPDNVLLVACKFPPHLPTHSSNWSFELFDGGGAVLSLRPGAELGRQYVAPGYELKKLLRCKFWNRHPKTRHDCDVCSEAGIPCWGRTNASSKYVKFACSLHELLWRICAVLQFIGTSPWLVQAVPSPLAVRCWVRGARKSTKELSAAAAAMRRLRGNDQRRKALGQPREPKKRRRRSLEAGAEIEQTATRTKEFELRDKSWGYFTDAWHKCTYVEKRNGKHEIQWSEGGTSIMDVDCLERRVKKSRHNE